MGLDKPYLGHENLLGPLGTFSGIAAQKGTAATPPRPVLGAVTRNSFDVWVMVLGTPKVWREGPWVSGAVFSPQGQMLSRKRGGKLQSWGSVCQNTGVSDDDDGHGSRTVS